MMRNGTRCRAQNERILITWQDTRSPHANQTSQLDINIQQYTADRLFTSQHSGAPSQSTLAGTSPPRTGSAEASSREWITDGSSPHAVAEATTAPFFARALYCLKHLTRAAFALKYQEMLITRGPGGNGKDTLANRLSVLLGTYFANLDSKALTVNRDMDAASQTFLALKAKRFVCIREIDKNV